MKAIGKHVQVEAQLLLKAPNHVPRVLPLARTLVTRFQPLVGNVPTTTTTTTFLFTFVLQLIFTKF